MILFKDLVKYNEISRIVSKFAKIKNFQNYKHQFLNLRNYFQTLRCTIRCCLKEMYSFKDRNNDFLTLRPEYTTPMIRAKLTNNLLNELPLKIFGIGQMFREKRPKRQIRKFNQINFFLDQMIILQT